MSEFAENIKKFNKIYGLASHDLPNNQGLQRLKDFRSILTEELKEVDDIIADYEEMLRDSKPSGAKNAMPEGGLSEAQTLTLLTDMSDWLGDIIVYCASEARRWGIPLDQVLKIIMESNFSKLDENGQPIHDHRGKVLKGPDYWKPEPQIAEILKARLASGNGGLEQLENGKASDRQSGSPSPSH